MTFNKHVKDFKFNVYYEDLGYLGEVESKYVGSPNVSTVEVKGVAEALEKNKGELWRFKGKLKMDLKIFFAINVLYKGSLLLKLYEYVDLGG